MDFEKNSAFHPDWGDRGHHESDAEVEARRTARKHELALDSLSPHPAKRSKTTEVYTESLEQWYELLNEHIENTTIHAITSSVPAIEDLARVRNEIYSYLRG